MAGIVEKINTDILRICREQIGLDILEVEKKIKKIADIEGGQQKPAFNQLNALAELYKVPKSISKMVLKLSALADQKEKN